MILKIPNKSSLLQRRKKNLHISSIHQYIANHYTEIVYWNIVSELKIKFFSNDLSQENENHIRQFCSSVLFPQSLSPSHTHVRGIHRSPQSNCESEHRG